MTNRDLRGRMLGEFVLHERIDDGSFGTVYRAKQRRGGRDVVVKVLHENLQRDDVALQRFNREDEVLARGRRDP